MFNSAKEISEKLARLVKKFGVTGTVANSVDVPTKAEFNALVADHNKLVAALKSKDINA